MNKTTSESIVRVAVLAAALAVSACAGTKGAPAPSQAKPPARDAAAAAPAPAAPSSAAAAQAAASIPMPAGALTRVWGSVVSADSAARTLTIKDRSGASRTFRLADGARLTKGGDDSAVQLSDLAAGDRVRMKVAGDVVAGVHVMVKPAS